MSVVSLGHVRFLRTSPILISPFSGVKKYFKN
jgi:hypothetical protein